MSEVSMKVTIAGRTYPLTVKSEDETGIRNAEQTIEESIAAFQKNYAVKDKQDLLAMSSLQIAARLHSKKESERIVEKVVETVEVPVDHSEGLLEIEKILDRFIQ